MAARRTGSRFVEPFFGTHRTQRGDKIYRLVGFSVDELDATGGADKFVKLLQQEGHTPLVETETIFGIKRLVGIETLEPVLDTIAFGKLIYILEGTIPKRVARVARGIKRGAKRARKSRAKGTTSLRGMRR